MLPLRRHHLQSRTMIYSAKSAIMQYIQLTILLSYFIGRMSRVLFQLVRAYLCVLALSDSRQRDAGPVFAVRARTEQFASSLIPFARSCVNIFSRRGIRRALPRIIPDPPPPQPSQAAFRGWLYSDLPVFFSLDSERLLCVIRNDHHKLIV